MARIVGKQARKWPYSHSSQIQPALLAIDDSDVGHRAEELVIFGISAFAFVDGLDVFDKLNGLYPLHHFEPKFIFRPQP